MTATSGAGVGRAAMLVITAGVVLLAVIALAAFTKGAQHARGSAAKQNLRQIKLALEKYGTDNGGVYPAYLIGGAVDETSGASAGTGPMASVRVPSGS